jgi:prepilin-type processing-associated H-X9-DG protein
MVSLVLGLASIGCLGFLTGIPAVVCGHMALARIRHAAGAMGGRGLALAGTALGYTGIALWLVIATAVAALLLPGISQARAKAQQVACLNQVKQLALGCLMYGQDYDTYLPQNWDQVRPYMPSDPDPGPLRCPAAPPEEVCSYGLVAEGRLDEVQEPSRIVMIRETVARHGGKRCVGYADGHCALVADGHE